MNLIQRFFKKDRGGRKQQLEPVPGNWHVDFIVHIARVLRPKLYVELGLYECELFNKVIPYAGKLIGVDLKRECGEYMVDSKKVKFVNSTTDEFAKDLRKRPPKIDMLFIDANHSSESVLKDFNSYFPFVSEQGLILLHDGYPKNKKFTDQKLCGDAYKTIEKLSKETKSFEMVTVPVHPGVTICRKRKTQLGWDK